MLARGDDLNHGLLVLAAAKNYIPSPTTVVFSSFSTGHLYVFGAVDRGSDILLTSIEFIFAS